MVSPPDYEVRDMTTSIFGSIRWLIGEETDGYGAWPIPHRIDEEISALLRSWLSLKEPLRKVALSQVTEDYRFTFVAYSERMASLAVRDRNSEHVLLGLLALGLDGWRGDWRDNAAVVCLHYDAAQKIGLCPDDLFEEAAKTLPDKPANALRLFLRRSEEDKSVEAMGYSAATDADGFRYKRTW